MAGVPRTWVRLPPPPPYFFMRSITRILTLLIVLFLAALPAQAQPAGTVTFSFSGNVAQVPRFGSRIELMPVLQLIGAQAGYSQAAGTYVIQLGKHQIQITPQVRFALVDGELEKTNDAAVVSPGGIAVSESYLDRVILSPFGYHLERSGTGYQIAPGAMVAPVVTVRAAAADFGTTTTLVLTLSRHVAATVTAGAGQELLVHFSDARPQLDGSLPMRSRRIVGIRAAAETLKIELAPGQGLLASHQLTGPDRVIVEVGRRPPTPVPTPVAQAHKPKRPTIVIDPGHGGADSGAVSVSGLEEKVVSLAVATRLATLLKRDGYVVRLTRAGDETRALTDRTALANRLDAVAFISLHANASTVRSVRGAETYYMSLHDATDAHAAETARKENAAGAPGRHGGSQLDLILWDMAQARVLNRSALLALDIQRQLNSFLDLPDRGVKQAPFVVLTGATMPAVLVEMGFLSNPAEARQLADPGYRQRLAEALARGIEEFLRSSS